MRGKKQAKRIKSKLILSDEQQLVCDEILKNNSVVVDSCIGSGKSTLISEVCNRYHELYPQTNILYLTYNNRLMEDAQKKIKTPNTTVFNFHTFANRIIAQITGRGKDPREQLRYFCENQKCIDAVTDRFGLICVDEFQDIDTDIAQFLLCLKNCNINTTWLFVGDMEQKIYPSRLDVYTECIDKIIPNYIPLKLTKSFRISSKYAKQLSHLWNKEIIGVNNTSKKITVSNFEEAYEIIDRYKTSEVLILGFRNSLSDIANKLEKINPVKYNKKTLWVNIGHEEAVGKTYNNPLILTTYDSCKGMERPVCVIMDWTAESFAFRMTNGKGMNQLRLRNIFLVAASRGKQYNIFVRSRNRSQITKDTFYTDYGEAKLKLQSPGNMFRYKDTADLQACMDYVQLENIPQEDSSQIEAQLSDYNIDLAPVVGMYQEIMFFDSFNRQKEVLLNRKISDRKSVHNWVVKWLMNERNQTPERVALGYVAISTEVLRYCMTATDRYISTNEKDRLRNRMAGKLNARSNSIQVECEYHDKFDCIGLIDYVDENDIPWELKFTKELSMDNILQAAMYMVMYNSPYVYLWNTFDNTLLRITVKDRDAFLAEVYNCITYGKYRMDIDTPMTD